MRSGVTGLTHQDQSVAQIAATLDAIEAGRNVLDPGPQRFPARDRNRLSALSPRENEILSRIAAGQSTRQMSCAMNITVDTVRTYVKSVLSVLRGVVRGDTWLAPRELGAVLRLLIEDQDHRRGGNDLLASLTRREHDVLILLVEGAGRQEVAERLQLSANTVRTHLHSLMAKLGVHSTLEVVALARPRLTAARRL